MKYLSFFFLLGLLTLVSCKKDDGCKDCYLRVYEDNQGHGDSLDKINLEIGNFCDEDYEYIIQTNAIEYALEYYEFYAAFWGNDAIKDLYTLHCN